MNTENHGAPEGAIRAVPAGTDDLTGRRFERLEVLGFLGVVATVRGRRRSRWLCRCDCGRECMAVADVLRARRKRSCGCLSSDVTAARNFTHGKSKTVEYTIWNVARDRSENPNNERYAEYGARGIGMCAGWKTDPASFLADMGPRPLRHSIDRIDNDGGYWCGHCSECVRLGRPANCRWATMHTQTRNMRRNQMITIDGETLCASDWAARIGVDPEVISSRIRKGWEPTLAVAAARMSPDERRALRRERTAR